MSFDYQFLLISFFWYIDVFKNCRCEKFKFFKFVLYLRHLCNLKTSSSIKSFYQIIILKFVSNNIFIFLFYFSQMRIRDQFSSNFRSVKIQINEFSRTFFLETSDHISSFWKILFCRLQIYSSISWNVLNWHSSFAKIFSKKKTMSKIK